MKKTEADKLRNSIQYGLGVMDSGSGEFKELSNKIDELFELSYLEGYSEATRWRDPKEELPENGEPVIVKYMTARGIKKYGIAKYFELGIGNPWTIEGSTGRAVIGWRPIE